MGNNEFITSFFDEEGNLERQLITGHFVAELVNLSDPDKSVIVNASGPGTLTFAGDITTLEAEGHLLVSFFPGDLGPDDPGMFLVTSGLWVIEFSADGTTIISRSGAAQDVCALLS